MKKLFIILCIALMCSCCENNSETLVNETVKTEIVKSNVKKKTKPYTNVVSFGTYGFTEANIKIVTIKGHEYLVATMCGPESGGIDIEHSESCPCLKKN